MGRCLSRGEMGGYNFAMDSARFVRVSEALSGDLDGLIATLLALSAAQRD